MFCGTTVGLPGMCLPMWRAEMAGVEVVAAADAKADRQIDGLALVELFDAGGTGQAGDNDIKALTIVLLWAMVPH